jgi:putative ABC transport system substrate-binding protein
LTKGRLAHKIKNKFTSQGENMKKILCIILGLFLLASCGTGTQNSESGLTPTVTAATAETPPTASGEPAANVYKIGVNQFIQHDALDASLDGFIDALAENGYEDGKNIEIEVQNASGDTANATSISQKFVADKKDLLLGIATPSAVSLARETSDIPILITAVTDPVEANLVESIEKPGRNVTGTSDLNPVKEQIDIALKFKPDIKTLAVLFSADEQNSRVQADMVKEYGDQIGITVDYKTISDQADIMPVMQSLAGNYDAVYTPTDNNIANAMASVGSVAREQKIIVIAAEEGMLRNGGLASVSISYYDLGFRTGQMAADVLDGKNPADMPIEYAPKYIPIINKNMADAIGIALPEDLPADSIIVTGEE